MLEQQHRETHARDYPLPNPQEYSTTKKDESYKNAWTKLGKTDRPKKNSVGTWLLKGQPRNETIDIYA